MPSTSKAQARTMAAAAHNPAFAKKVGIPQKVATEFNQADKAKHSKKPAGHKLSGMPLHHHERTHGNERNGG